MAVCSKYFGNLLSVRIIAALSPRQVASDILLAISRNGLFQLTSLQPSKIKRFLTRHLYGTRIAHVSGKNVVVCVLNFNFGQAQETASPRQHGLAFANLSINQQPKCRIAARRNVSDND
jgi:hypothetical protein